MQKLNTRFFGAAAVRALRTTIQTAVAMLPTTAGIPAVGWREIASTAALAGLASLLTSIAAGLPEVGTAEKILLEEETNGR